MRMKSLTYEDKMFEAILPTLMLDEVAHVMDPTSSIADVREMAAILASAVTAAANDWDEEA